MLRSPNPLVLATVLAALIVGAATVAPLTAQEDPRLARARAYLDNGEPEAALLLTNEVLAKGKPNAEALLLRSTGRAMTADLRGRFEDLQRALNIDPALRQGWLNLAGLEIAEGRYKAAYNALRKAQALDPSAVDNYLNLGAVLVLQKQLEPAREQFAEYLKREGSSAEANYLVAANYALARYQQPAVEHLRRAVELDERIRLRARSDDRFLGIDDRPFRELLNTDLYTLPAGSHSRAAAFRVPHNPVDNRLLYAVLEALNRLGVDYSPGVETSADWALIWGEMRIKVHNQANGTGVVSLSAPADRFTAEGWQHSTQELLGTIHRILGE